MAYGDDYYYDQGLPPAASLANEPTTAPNAPPGFELGYPTVTPAPSYTPYPGGIPSNPFATATPMPGGPGGPPSATIQDTGDFGGLPTSGLFPGSQGYYSYNPSGGGAGGSMDFYDPYYDYGGGDVPTAPGVSPAVAPAQSVYDINWATSQTVPGAPGEPVPGGVQGPLYAGQQPQGSKFFQDLGLDMRDIGNFFKGIPGTIGKALSPNVGHYSPEYLASIGYEPGAGRGSQWPGAGPTTTSYDIGAYGAGGQGGSFFHGNTGAGPLAGSFAGLGGGWTQGVTGMIPFWQREEMRRAHATMRRGYRSPLIGTGDAVAQFATNLGSHPRYQGAYSPAAAMAAMAAVSGGTQQAGGGGGAGMPEDRGARGPGGRAMSPV